MLFSLYTKMLLLYSIGTLNFGHIYTDSVAVIEWNDSVRIEKNEKFGTLMYCDG
jgi:hypothetical protein